MLALFSIAEERARCLVGDLSVSHAVQAYSSGWLDIVLGTVSWFGFPPQSDILFGVIAVVLLVAGARVAAVTETISALGSGGLYLVLEHVVEQPRPSADLVRVTGPIEMTGFPSGHLATFVAVFGFLAFVGYRRFAPSLVRCVPVALVVVLLLVMGFARIYSGHHWASDVLAGALLGALWLLVVIRICIWGESRSFDRQLSVPRDAIFGRNNA